MRRLILYLSLAVFLTLVHAARAQGPGLEFGVKGMACTFCAYAFEQQLKDMGGVESLEVDVRSGKATIYATDDAKLNTGIIDRLARQAGFTLQGVKTSAIGEIRISPIGFTFHVQSTGKDYLLYERMTASHRYVSGQNIHALSQKTADTFAAIMNRGNKVRARGLMHDHKDLPSGLMLEKYEEIRR